ncbi:hypothetical protein LTR10_015104 [Elasticomyces elasticus]|uniref:Major facilitator superfamily (MFS) profile domain-containing protein n=1 Tax=Exophiala sideris TaxID=1016849 RepID=A0ABR0JQV8_9EURO|nr:hypothetical protein LTR10_015104 [Elasticomyces elasticus]KAK5034698.1 hypothetical protein LTR13_006354 [Exophiala sideris]KAK5039980.1 hypothetical protein LTS07_000475 [Exophiala sideris]KAK5068358.1 hypothetical protein LTR69_000476 [Exophiala sideris]KAK5187660.1 hypothetical protein LTR44_000476 [Eurotiomycetes sp. CCFEE 6388]
MATPSVVPGTVHLVDLQNLLTVKHAKGHLADVVLVPAPSNDPDDPLNWSKRRKALSTVSMCVYITMTGLACSAVYSILVPISHDTGLTINDLNAGTGYQYLAFGWGCLIWQPAAQTFGKRPIYLISLLMTMAVTVSVPYVRTPGSWMALKILQGFVGAPIESLGEISISDVYFSHQRGSYMAIYALTLYTAGFLASVFAGFINDGLGWRWVQYRCAIWVAMGFVFCFFFMEETNYHRHSILNDEAQLASAATHANPDSETQIHQSKSPGLDEIHHTEQVHSDSQYQRKSYLAKMKMFEKRRPLKHFWFGVMRPLKLMTFPVIAYCGFNYGASLIWYNILNATASLILSGAPYNFPASMVGLTYLSPIIGVFIGSFISGKLGDILILRLARRNKGIWESEHRMWLYLILALVVPFSLILWGVGAAHGIHWFGLVFAMAVTGVSVSIGAQLALSYCIDTYKDLGADAIVSVVCIRNTMSFAIGYGVTPWVVNMGYQNAFLVAAFAGLAQVLTFLIFMKWGPRLRAASAERYRKEVERAMKIGYSH